AGRSGGTARRCGRRVGRTPHRSFSLWRLSRSGGGAPLLRFLAGLLGVPASSAAAAPDLAVIVGAVFLLDGGAAQLPHPLEMLAAQPFFHGGGAALPGFAGASGVGGKAAATGSGRLPALGRLLVCHGLQASFSKRSARRPEQSRPPAYSPKGVTSPTRPAV